ncbi:hypothetical protein [Clostridium algidicarnis]|uniref:hypothetical protein n=1 Tax=Clostridium algidicarnis TaxID=37659 RepID=UPI001C0D7395|nr:hypothetical protein [Clostridium algidicarnis]MBU3228080.1 hypothetical protein [Clostridium algidicarnis]MBU3251751.1 hypothetical protein [Clostridium algidicarnis]
MSKNITKTLAATLAATLGAGIVPVMAQTSKSLDELHKAAYTAVAVAKKDKTQKSINDARVVLAEYKAAIEAEEKLGLLPNVNTFSVQLDEVQHPILSDIVKSILAIQKAGTATQAEINEVRTMLEGDQADETDDLPKGFDSYKKTWNADLDVYQTKLMDAAIEAVKVAETEKTQATVDAAKVLVADLATAVRPGIQKIAADLQTKVEAVKVYDLKVTKAVISLKGVEVTFDALKEALRDVKLEVIDNDGKKVAVKEQSLLIEDETTSTFKFEKELSERGVGVWTVNGLEVNLDAMNLVNDVQKPMEPEALFAILTKSGLVNNLIDEVANQKEYQEVIEARVSEEKINTVANVQKAIDDANKNVVSSKQVEVVVKAANTSNATLSKFTTEFNKLNLERVNPEWITEYRTEINTNKPAPGKLSEVQGIVDRINNDKIKEIDKVENLKDEKGQLSESKIEKAMALVEKYVVVEKDDEAAAKAKEKKINDLKVKLAIVRVNEADTQTSLKAALKNLEKVVNDKDAFEYDTLVNESLMKIYLNGDFKKVTTKDEVIDKIQEIQQKAIDSAVEKITTTANSIVIKEATTDAEKAKFKSDILEAFKNLETVSAKADVKFDASKVDDNLWDLYVDAFKTKLADTAAVQLKVTGVNDTVVKTLMAKTQSADGILIDGTLLKTLQDKRLGLTNVIDKNEQAYVLDFNNLKSIESKEKLVRVIDVINSKEIIMASNSVATVKDELTKIAVKTKLKEYINLTDAQKLDVAELLTVKIAKIEKNKTTNLEQLKGYLTEVDTERKTVLDEINKTADSTTNTISELNKISPEFKALGDVAKVTVAEKFNANRPTKTVSNVTTVVPFGDFTAIRTVLAKSMK